LLSLDQEPGCVPGLREARGAGDPGRGRQVSRDRKSTRLNSSHVSISYAVFCLKKKKINFEKFVVESWRKLTPHGSTYRSTLSFFGSAHVPPQAEPTTLFHRPCRAARLAARICG